MVLGGFGIARELQGMFGIDIREGMLTLTLPNMEQPQYALFFG